MPRLKDPPEGRVPSHIYPLWGHSGGGGGGGGGDDDDDDGDGDDGVPAVQKLTFGRWSFLNINCVLGQPVTELMFKN